MTDRKILVALDRSPQSEAVLERALSLAVAEGAQVRLLYVLPVEQEFAASSGLYGSGTIAARHLQERLDGAIASAKEWLDACIAQAQERGVTAEAVWHLGEPGRWIREVAGDWHADLVIVGRHGRRGLSELLLGSVSNYVVHHAPCSVLVVQGEETAPADRS